MKCWTLLPGGDNCKKVVSKKMLMCLLEGSTEGEGVILKVWQ